MDSKLLEYIKNSLSKGTDRQTIENELLNKGWSKEQIEQAFRAANSPQDQPEVSSNRQSKAKTLILIAAAVVFLTLVSIGTGSYLLWYLPKVQTQQYIEKSRPIFERLRDQLRVTKENAFLDIRTQRSSIQEAADDTDKDIEEIENNLSALSTTKKELASIKKTKKVEGLDNLLTDYFGTAENSLQGLLAHQKFQRKMIDAFGFTLDSEIQNYTKAFYAGGQRPDFIIQTQKIADLASDALSRMNTLEVPPDDEEYHALKKENLEDIKTTFQNINEFYRLGQDDLVTNAVAGITQRVENKNKEIKQNSQNFVDSSRVASDFRKLEDLESEITALISNKYSQFYISNP